MSVPKPWIMARITAIFAIAACAWNETPAPPPPAVPQAVIAIFERLPTPTLNPASTKTPLPTATATQTATETPTWIPTVLPTGTSSPTSVPTPVPPTPTYTPTPMPTAMPTAMPTPTASPTPVQAEDLPVCGYVQMVLMGAGKPHEPCHTPTASP